MDTKFVKATVQSVQPHLDEVKTHLDDVAAAGKDADPQHILNHLSAVNVNVGLVQTHAGADVKAKAPDVVQKAATEVKKVVGEVEDAFKSKPVASPAPTVAPVTKPTASWVRIAEYVVGGAILVAMIAYGRAHGVL